VLERSWEGPQGSGSERTEIWWAGDRYKVAAPAATLYSDGDYRWSVDPKGERATQSLALGMGEEFQPWDIRLMAKYAQRFPATTVGFETVAGRRAVKLELERAGGEPWHLWVDAETNLPLQFTRRTDVLESFRYVQFEVNPTLSDQLFAYTPPASAQVVVREERWVDSVEAAAQVRGFAPLLPQEAPRRVAVNDRQIILDFGDTLIYQSQPEQFTPPVGWGFLKGQAGGSTLYIQGDAALTWHQQGIAVRVLGTRAVELARQIAPDLALPDPTQDLISAAQVKVAVDLAEANRAQRLLDSYAEDLPYGYPVGMAAAFVSGRSNPQVDRPIAQVAEWLFDEEANTGVEAIVVVSEGPVSRVYLKRVVRQDYTGAWVVVGYDLR